MSRLAFVVEADGTIRDSQDHLIREEHQQVAVADIGALPQAVLDIVQVYWPEATASDISWASDPLTWDGVGKLHWSTCAEIDGLVMSAPPGRPAMDDFDDLIGAIDAEPSVDPGDKEDEVDPAIPDGLVAYVRSICRTEWVAKKVLETAASKVLRRLRHDTPEARRARWGKRWRTENQAATKKWLGQVRDRVLREHHQIHVFQHDTYTTLPDDRLAWKPNESGTLVIDESKDTTISFGDPAYLEQTPVNMLVWILETWIQRQVDAFGDETDFIRRLRPRLWDLTSGSGTASDFFGKLHGCDIVSTDLVAPHAGTNLADCRNVGFLPEHGGKLRFGQPEVVIAEPDVVLFDPSAPGSPLHSQIYGTEPNLKDLGLLDREHWIITVADVAVRATKALVDGGFVSLLLRTGFRIDGTAVADPRVVDDFKTVLGNRATIAHEMPLAFRTVRNQVSLGAARLPAVHLMLTRTA